MRAAVLHRYGGPVTVEDVELDDPADHEVRVEIRASAVCRSDAHCRAGHFPVYSLPLVPGHEAAGVVTAVGRGVTRVGLGDHVVVTWNSSCGACRPCRRGEPIYCLDIRNRYGRQHDGTNRWRLGDRELFRGMDAGTFTEEGVYHENALVPVPRSLPFEEAALLGCTVATGVGAALNTAAVQPGDQVVVIGCGAVGLAVIQGCRIAGAEMILACDVSEDRLAVALALGATAVAGPDDVVAEVARATGGLGVDIAFEAVGSEPTLRTGLDLARRGGRLVLIGSLPAYQPVELYPGMLTLAGKSIVGCCYGSFRPDRDVPRLVELRRDGRLVLDLLLTRRIGLDGVDGALTAATGTENLRSVVVPAGVGADGKA